jgi:hypothetical protein
VTAHWYIIFSNQLRLQKRRVFKQIWIAAAWVILTCNNGLLINSTSFYHAIIIPRTKCYVLLEKSTVSTSILNSSAVLQ